MDQVAHRILRFGHFALDLTRGCLRKDGQEIELPPKPFEVLRHLAENQGRLVSKDELFAAVWPNVTVSDDSLVQCIRELRDKLGDGDHTLIKTVPRRGYLLEALPPPESAEEFVPVPASGAVGRTGWRPTPVLAGITGALLCAAVIAIAWRNAWLSEPVATSSAVAISLPHQVFKDRPVVKDCPNCPEMVALPAGQFVMGSPADERGRLRAEGLPRTVTIKAPFALGRFEVTVGQFEAFVTETGFTVSNQCRLIEKIEGDTAGFSPPKTTFRQMSYQVTDTQPVGCMSLHDAQAYAAWLRRRTGKPYRLPTEAEWEYAARAGTDTVYSFGDDERQLCEHSRFADLDTPFGWRNICRSGITTYGPLAVGRLKPNPWGLFDMHGNIWEWVEDCWTPDAAQIPTDGSALAKSGICEVGVLRGGSWVSSALRMRSAYRLPQGVARHDENMGFRVALSLPSSAQTNAAATQPISPLMLAVLPFANIGGDGEQSRFAEAVSGDLTGSISWLRGRVVAQSAAATYKDKQIDVRQVGRELGARYVLEGTVERLQDNVRITARLVDSATASIRQTETVDVAASELLRKREDTVALLARMLNLEIILSLSERSVRERPDHPDAIDLSRRGSALLMRASAGADIMQARRLFREALKLDDSLGLAWSGLTFTYTRNVRFSPTREQDLVEAAAAAERAVATAPDLEGSHLAMGWVHYERKRINKALASFEHAVRLNPNEPFAHASVAAANIMLGKPDNAVEPLRKAMRLSPRDPNLPRWQMFMGVASLHRGKDDEAVEWLTKSAMLDPADPFIQLFLASALSLSGREADAKTHLAELLRVRPEFTLGKFKAIEPSDEPAFRAQRERIFAALLRIGVPE